MAESILRTGAAVLIGELRFHAIQLASKRTPDDPCHGSIVTLGDIAQSFDDRRWKVVGGSDERVTSHAEVPEVEYSSACVRKIWKASRQERAARFGQYGVSSPMFSAKSPSSSVMRLGARAG